MMDEGAISKDSEALTTSASELADAGMQPESANPTATPFEADSMSAVMVPDSIPIRRWNLSFCRYKASYGSTPLEVIDLKVQCANSIKYWDQTEAIPITKPKFWKKQENEAIIPVHVMEPREVNGKVCVYDGTYVDNAIAACVRAKSLALIVTKPLNGRVLSDDMPVFCLDNFFVEQILSWEDARVRISFRNVKRGEVEEASARGGGEGGNVGSVAFHTTTTKEKHDTGGDLPLKEAENVEAGFSYREAAAVGFSESKGKNNKAYLSKKEKKAILSSGDDNHFGATKSGAKAKKIKEEKGFFQAAVGAAVGAVKTLIGGEKEDDSIFFDVAGWTAKHKFKSYREAMDRLHKIGLTKDINAAKAIVKSMPDFLQRAGGNIIIKLAFAARLLVSIECEETGLLLQNVIRILHDLDFASKKPDLEALQKHFDEDWMKPTYVLNDAFAKIINFRRMHDLERSSKVWLNLLYLWLRCGLLKSPIPWNCWGSLRRRLGANFCDNSSIKLKDLLLPSRLNTLSIFWRSNVKDVHATIIRLKQPGQRLRVEPAVTELLQEVCRRFLWENSQDIVLEWVLLFQALDECVFTSQNDAIVRDRTIYAIVRQTSFANNKTFRMYTGLVNGVASFDNGILKRKTHLALQKSLLSDISTDNDGPSALEVFQFLCLPWPSMFLSDKKSVNIIINHLTISLLDDRLSISDKLLLLGGLHQLVGDKGTKESGILAELSRVLENFADKSKIIEATYEVGSDCPKIFCVDGSAGFAYFISHILVKSLSWDRLTESDMSIASKAILGAQARDGSLALCFASTLKSALLRESKDMRSASIIFENLCRGDGDTCLSLQLALGLFCESFDKWKPKSFQALAREGDNFSLFTKCLSVAECHSKDLPEEHRKKLICVRGEIVNLLQAVADDFMAGDVTREDLEIALPLSGSEAWTHIENALGVRLPYVEDIENKMVEIDALITSINLSLSAPNSFDGSLGDILRAYCAFGNDTSLSHLLSAYASFVEAKPQTTTSWDVLTAPLRHRSLNTLRHDEQAALSFKRRCAEAIDVCAYFLMFPSFLFQEQLSLTGGYEDPFDLQRCVKQACTAVKQLFGKNALFDDIRKATLLLEKENASLGQEMETLLGCGVLDLDRDGCHRFSLSSLICKIQEPIASLVGFCEQFDFDIIQNDPSFEALKGAVEVMRSQETLSCQEEQCERLYGIFFVNNAAKRNNHAELESLLPLLKLLRCLRQHSEIWNLAKEKNWFSKEGLNAFYERLEHLSNSDMSAYDTTFLELMDPTVRVLSVVGSCSTEKSLPVMIKTMLGNQHLQQWLLDGRYQDFGVVQQNLSSVRRWFCDEQDDESAAVYQKFATIGRSGRYVFFLKRDGSREATWGLEYKSMGAGGAQESNTLDFAEVEKFMEQLRLFRQDANYVSDDVDRCLDQYAIIRTAFQSLLKLHFTGFPQAELDDFTCSFGGDIHDARNVLQKSRLHIQQCDMWLEKTRKRFPLSLLFSPEELRELYSLLVGTETLQSTVIARKLNRLTPPAVRSSAQYQQLVAIVPKLSELLSDYSNSWLVGISTAIEFAHKALGEPYTNLKSDRPRELVVHTIACEDNFKGEAILGVLQSIYKVRLPFDFEVLDGRSITSEKLCVFLERATNFISYTFVILNVEDITKDQLATVRSFLTDKETHSGVSLHCIQREPTLPTSSPFFEGKIWANDCLRRLKALENHVWQNCIIGNDTFESALIVLSGSCCSGKTRYIRSQQKLYLEQSVSREIGTISVHEGSTANGIMAAISSKFSCSVMERSIHFSILAIPKEETERSEWFEQINSFFVAFFVLRNLHHSDFSTQVDGQWQVFIEFPSEEVSPETWLEWSRIRIPILGLVGQPCEPPNQYQIDRIARRVCTYLRAFDDKSIDNQYEPDAKKQIVFVLDRSESMEYRVDGDQQNGKTQLSAATDCALQIFESHIEVGDSVGVTLFNHSVREVFHERVESEQHKGELRQQLDYARNDIPAGGGTHMYSALSHVLRKVEKSLHMETWIVVLTDGDTDSTDDEQELRRRLERSSEKTHLIIVGVNLSPLCEDNMKLICRKYRNKKSRRMKGFYVSAESTLDSIKKCFRLVSSMIPVSQTFDLLGEPTDEECRELIVAYAPKHVQQNMQLLSFWLRFLYRRVSIMDKNQSFNFNQSKENMGSCLMRTMLNEVSRLVQTNHEIDWIENNYAQLIYDFSNPESPEFRLMCTSPNQMDEGLMREYEELELPGFSVPSERWLRARSNLELILSQATNSPLVKGADGILGLQCIEDYVLTRDFTVKILNMHERISSGSPCIIEGETGVSKTALTNAYCRIRNSTLLNQCKHMTARSLQEIEQKMLSKGFSVGDGADPAERMMAALKAAALQQDAVSELSSFLSSELQTLFERRSPLFQERPADMNNDRTGTVVKLIQFIAESNVEKTFFELNIHASLKESDILAWFKRVREVARKVMSVGALVVVFLDEINTSSTSGLLKEIVADRSLLGDMIEENIVAVAACNPARQNVFLCKENQRDIDLGRFWTSGHYQVSELPPAMAMMKWSFGSLNKDQEKEFIFFRLKQWTDRNGNGVPLSLQIVMTELVATSQEAMRRFAKEDLGQNLRGQRIYSKEDIEAEVEARAKSVVSLRDIQQVFVLFDFFMHDFPFAVDISGKHRNSMLLAVAVVYYFRLDSLSRQKYFELLKNIQGDDTPRMYNVLSEAMDTVVAHTKVKEGIAFTRGLRENLFMTFVCTLAVVPLMIVGPPGCSKTLSVHTIGDNANGEESLSPFYRSFARLAMYLYQSSKESSSTQVLAVFEKARRRQVKVDSRVTRCTVVMDEAGLPEAKREALKVLHYLLERRDVSFVGITNRVLDAAKSNRCVMVFRDAPDEGDMLAISEGILFRSRGVRNVELGGRLVEPRHVARSFCSAYFGLLEKTQKNLAAGHLSGIKGCRISGMDYVSDCEEAGKNTLCRVCGMESFFGLRDFFYFLKAMRMSSSVKGTNMILELSIVTRCIERNFNGVDPESWQLFAFEMLRHIVDWPSEKVMMYIKGATRCPMSVIQDALLAKKIADGSARFTLIIDCSEDDSAIRVLDSAGLLNLRQKTTFRLSEMPEEKEPEKQRLVSGVKSAAATGGSVVLAQTDTIDAAFYDLHNKNFRGITSVNGKTTKYASIAFQGKSAKCPVHESFNCIVMKRESELQETPAAFLNRFEKFRLDICDVLSFGWASLGQVSLALQQSRQRTSQLLGILGNNGVVGWAQNGRTLDSVFAGLLPTWALNDGLSQGAEESLASTLQSCNTFVDSMKVFLEFVSTMRIPTHKVAAIVEEAGQCFQGDHAKILKQLTSENDSEAIRQFIQALKNLLKQDATDLFERSFTVLRDICLSITQICFTEYVVARLMQIVQPESLYAARHRLPEWLIKEYFDVEHFSLERYMQNVFLGREESKYIVHTRTDAFLHSIPSFNTRDRHKTMPLSDREVIGRLVCQDIENVIVEHLFLLRSESSLRSLLSTWSSGDKRALVLIVDMNKSGAKEQVNYVRGCVDECTTPGKVFVLLLHYPPSSPLRFSYPALFLRRWQHVFLDGVGQSGPSMGLSASMQAACLQSFHSDKELPSQIYDVLLETMPNVLSSLACKSFNLFYDKQDELGLANRLELLKKVTSTELQNGTIGSVLCHKFADHWLRFGLENAVNSACTRLQRGTSQLSVSLSIQSNFLEAFEKFMIWSIREINTWNNYQLLLSDNLHSDVLELFGFMLKALDMPPFGELMLIHERGSPMPKLPQTMSNQIPFFYLISTAIDELLELATTKYLEDGYHEINAHIDPFYLCKWGMSFDPNSLDHDPNVRIGPRIETMFQVVGMISKSKALWYRYLNQFVQCRGACSSPYFVLNWLQKKLTEMGYGDNIVAVHCLARCCSLEFMKVASWSVAAKICFPQWEAFDTHTGQKSLREIPSEMMLNSVEYLEKMVAETDIDLTMWKNSIAAILQLVSLHTDDSEVMQRIRILCLFGILLGTSNRRLLEETMNFFYDSKRRAIKPAAYKSASLAMLYRFVEGIKELETQLLWQIFLPFASGAFDAFYCDDLTFLLDAIEEGRLQRHSRRDQVALLWRACQCSGTSQNERFVGFSADVARILESKLSRSCTKPTVYSMDGTRVSYPHFIPDWLKSGEMYDPAATEIDEFLSPYEHTFEGLLAPVCFDMFLEHLLRQSDVPSSDILQRLLHDIEVEERGRDSAPDDKLLIGSAVSAIITDARILCFLFGLARDLAHSEESALTGPYAEICNVILHSIMQAKPARFRDFFFSQVFRHRGGGRVLGLLSGPLQDLPWCRSMRDGAPTLVEQQRIALQRAEDSLAEKIDDENAKVRDLKLCPRCSRPFGVASRGCGQFTCGQDAHGLIGNESHGCGHGFSIDAAPQYRVNENELGPLRDAVEAQRAVFEAAQADASIWNSAMTFSVPTILIFVENLPAWSNIAPSASMIRNCEDDSRSRMVNVLIRGADSIENLQLLVDLIEFYVWLHSVFHQVLSRDEAIKMTVGDVMEEQRLRRRFDEAQAGHIISLWKRAVRGTKRLLKQMEYKALWNCQEIPIPFRDISKAHVISLLSEGVDPTDGFDCLFLIINEIISEYNSSVTTLAEYRGTGSHAQQADTSINPMFLLSGSGGAAIINQSSFLSTVELGSVVGGAWNPDSCQFDLERFDELLRFALTLRQQTPTISNPVQCLRRKFLFRLESDSAKESNNGDSGVFKHNYGFFFAREEDLRLLLNVQEGLEEAFDSTPDMSIWETLCTELHAEMDSHFKTRQLLVALRNFVEFSSTAGLTDFVTLGKAISQLSLKESCKSAATVEMGFPELSGNNIELILSLSLSQLSTMVKYLGFQLASEGYFYSDLPVYMAEPIAPGVIDKLLESCHKLVEEHGTEQALKSLREFAEDVLIFYKSQLEEAANARNQSLVEFLSSSNFCGTEDYMFAALPQEIRLQNYVSLRQHLQQLALSLQYGLNGADENFNDAARNSQESSISLSGMSRGQCWMWQQGLEGAIAQLKPASRWTSSQPSSTELWFADCLKEANRSEANDVVDTETSPSLLHKSAARIQRWWLQVSFRYRDLTMDIQRDSDDSKFYDAVTAIDEMEEDSEDFYDFDDFNGKLVISSGAEELVQPSCAELEQWLDSNGLPQNVSKDLAGLGARCIQDVCMLVNDCHELLDSLSLTKLDDFKLRKAVNAYEREE